MKRHRLHGAVYSATLEILDAEGWADRGDRLLLAVERDGVRALSMVEVGHVRPDGSMSVATVYGSLAIGDTTAMRAPLADDPRPAVRRAVLRGPLRLVTQEER